MLSHLNFYFGTWCTRFIWHMWIKQSHSDPRQNNRLAWMRCSWLGWNELWSGSNVVRKQYDPTNKRASIYHGVLWLCNRHIRLYEVKTKSRAGCHFYDFFPPPSIGTGTILKNKNTQALSKPSAKRYTWDASIPRTSVTNVSFTKHRQVTWNHNLKRNIFVIKLINLFIKAC